MATPTPILPDYDRDKIIREIKLMLAPGQNKKIDVDLSLPRGTR